MRVCHSDYTYSGQRVRTALRQCADLHPKGGHVAMSHKVFHCVQNFGDRHSGRGQARRTAQLCAPCTLNISCFGHKKTPYALRAWAWGGRGRLFKSGHSDQYVKTAFHYCGEPFFYLSKHFNTKKLRRNIGAFDFVLHLRKLCKFCFQCRIDLSVKLVVFFVFRYSLCLRLLYLVGLYYSCTSLWY